MRLPQNMRWPSIALVSLCFAGVGLGTLAVQLRTPQTGPSWRGERLYRELGCVGCHGPQGSGGVPNPGSALGTVPGLRLGGAIKAYVQSEAELREWILDGGPARLRAAGRARSPAVKSASELRPLLQMPAYRGLISGRELDDLVSYVKGVAALERPLPDEAEAGRRLAEGLGCFGCHGMDGRGGVGNPRSFKRYIPSWDSEDFAKLVRGESELREWILDGTSERMSQNPIASFFLERQAIRMPAYREILSERDLDALVAYISWLREAERRHVERWIEPEEVSPASAVERGRYLYRRAGCVSCHGPNGEGGLANRNAAGGFVPTVNDLAEKLGLDDPELLERVVRVLDAGGELETLRADPTLRGAEDGGAFDDIAAEYQSHLDLILNGSRARKRRDQGPEPPISMPSWRSRAGARADEPIAAADIDALMAYLLSLAQKES